MKLLRRGNSGNSDESADSSPAADPATNPQVTAAKGRPTPKRRDAESRRRGPVAPAPQTAKEARARRKATRGSKLERKQSSVERRELAKDRRARMLAGEEAYLLPRDRGPARAFTRDIVDARRNLVGLFMPLALVLILTMLLSPVLQTIVTLAMLVMMLFMVGEGVFIGRMINRRVRERFPDTTDGGMKLGWYAFVRASQIRKMRMPKPRVKPGDAV